MKIKAYFENRHLKKLEKQAKKVMALEEKYKKLTDDELKNKTIQFKEELKNGKSIDDIKIEASATVREAAFRVLGMQHYFVQIIGGLALLNGDIAEMATGEGKTLVASIPSYIRALEGKGVHVVTTNEYLAKRDKEQIGQVHEFLGLTVGLNLSEMEVAEKQKAYQSDITYGVSNEFGFDYLRDHLVYSSDQRVQRPLYYAIIDEVDSILIDEARTPLIIAGKTQGNKGKCEQADKIIKTLVKDKHYEVYLDSKSAAFTDEGIDKIQRILGIDNLYDMKHYEMYHHLVQSLHANAVLRKNVDYIVEDDAVKLVDLNTGRVMEGRTLSDGLHQAIEAKENVTITDENKTQSMITLQNYFRKYHILSGMTGTAKTEEKEFRELYNMIVVQVPTNRPLLRKDHKDKVYEKKEEKYKAIIEEVKKEHAKGRPILIGTSSIEKSLEVAEQLDKHTDIPFELLNANTIEHEARLIASAGEEGSVIIATNMAGRGTDIILDRRSKELGGLLVICTERHLSRRIDNQLIGRSGRQGDRGDSKFFISLEDELFKRFAEERLESFYPKIKKAKDGSIINKEIYNIITSTQKVAEGLNYSVRSYTTKLDDVLNNQRDVIYELREKVLEDDEKMIHSLIKLTKEYIDNEMEHYYSKENNEWRVNDLESFLKELLNNDIQFKEEHHTKKGFRNEIEKYIQQYEQNIKEKHLKNMVFSQLLRQRFLSIIDRTWRNHLMYMNDLKNGIFLRSYAQEDPLDIYQIEGYELFVHTMEKLSEESSKLLSGFNKNIQIEGNVLKVVGF